MLYLSAVRAIQTVNIVLDVLNLDKSILVITSGFLEQSQGVCEGLDCKSPQILEVIKRIKRENIEFCAPEGESFRMVQQRAIRALKPYIEKAKRFIGKS